jgi:hypothetical protein
MPVAHGIVYDRLISGGAKAARKIDKGDIHPYARGFDDTGMVGRGDQQYFLRALHIIHGMQSRSVNQLKRKKNALLQAAGTRSGVPRSVNTRQSWTAARESAAHHPPGLRER